MSEAIDVATLPAPVREALAAIGIDRAWFAAAEPGLGTTVVNLWVKLDALGLWPHLEREDESGLGCLHARVADPAALRRALAEHPRMSAPNGPPDARWDSRELGARATLHIKHFDGWPPDRIQAHIDPWGMRPASLWWWLLPVVPLGLLLLHALAYHGYREVDALRALLVARGLAGEGTWGRTAALPDLGSDEPSA